MGLEEYWEALMAPRLWRWADVECGGEWRSAIWIRQMGHGYRLSFRQTIRLLQPPAGVRSVVLVAYEVLVAHTCSQSRPGAGIMAHALCRIVISVHC